MSKISEIIHSLQYNWSEPRIALHRGQPCSLPLTCIFSSKPSETEAIDILAPNVPDDVRSFWLVSQNAYLFKDQKYGQWGLEILDPISAGILTMQQKSSRPKEFQSSDLVLGKFLGDSDLLILSRNTETPNYDCIMIALPIDGRSAWPIAANSFTEFLENFVSAQGDKYWEKG